MLTGLPLYSYVMLRYVTLLDRTGQGRAVKMFPARATKRVASQRRWEVQQQKDR
jgi:hypothetical protein